MEINKSSTTFLFLLMSLNYLIKKYLKLNDIILGDPLVKLSFLCVWFVGTMVNGQELNSVGIPCISPDSNRYEDISTKLSERSHRTITLYARGDGTVTGNRTILRQLSPHGLKHNGEFLTKLRLAGFFCHRQESRSFGRFFEELLFIGQMLENIFRLSSV